MIAKQEADLTTKLKSQDQKLLPHPRESPSTSSKTLNPVFST